ncbi:MAG: hypothetical protein JWN01_1158 [Patescibacteria group bacterium]|nr:hypothetical protein [Patescibacteria group bacterium]
MAPATLPDAWAFCIFCPNSNDEVPAGEVTAKNDLGYLTQAGRMVDGTLVLEEEHWLLVPREHISIRSKMPQGWDEAEYYLISQIPGFGPDEADWPPYVAYSLYGTEVGQTMAHRHTHVRIGGKDGIKLTLGGQ